MEREQLKVTSFLLPAALVIGFAGCNRATVGVQQAQAQNSRITTMGGGTTATPDPAHGKAAGERQPFRPTSKDLRASLSAHPAPDVWLVFPAAGEQAEPQDTANGGSASNVKVELPLEAKEVLSSYWKYLLTVRRDTDLVEMINAQHGASYRLQKLQIDATDKRRAIAWDEARSLVDFIDASFDQLMEEAGKYRTWKTRLPK